MTDKIFDKNIKKLIGPAGPGQTMPENEKEQILNNLINSAAQPQQEMKTFPIWKLIIKHPLTKFTAAAVIIIAVGLFIVHQGPDEHISPKPDIVKSELSPTTLLSMSLAFQKGGLPGLEKHCDKALEAISNQSPKINLSDILKELNNNKNERI